MAWLPESVYHGGDAQRPFLAMGFGDFQAFDGLTYQEKIKPLNIQGLTYGNWWRRRELNPRPQYLDHRIYMHSLSIGFNRTALRQTG